MLTNGNAEDSFELELGTVTDRCRSWCVDSFQRRPTFWLVVSFAQMPVPSLKVSEIDLFLAEENFLTFTAKCWSVDVTSVCSLVLLVS